MTTIQDAGEDLLRKLDVLFPGQACDTLALAQAVSRLIDAKLASASPSPPPVEPTAERKGECRTGLTGSHNFHRFEGGRDGWACDCGAFQTRQERLAGPRPAAQTLDAGSPGTGEGNEPDGAPLRSGAGSNPGEPVHQAAEASDEDLAVLYCDTVGTSDPRTCYVAARRALYEAGKRRGQGEASGKGETWEQAQDRLYRERHGMVAMKPPEPLPLTLPPGTRFSLENGEWEFLVTARLVPGADAPGWYTGMARHLLGRTDEAHVKATSIDWRSAQAAQTPEPPKGNGVDCAQCGKELNGHSELRSGLCDECRLKEPSEAGKGGIMGKVRQAIYDEGFEAGKAAAGQTAEHDAERIEGLWALIPKDLPWCDECKGSGGIATPCAKCRGVGRLPRVGRDEDKCEFCNTSLCWHCGGTGYRKATEGPAEKSFDRAGFPGSPHIEASEALKPEEPAPSLAGTADGDGARRMGDVWHAAFEACDSDDTEDANNAAQLAAFRFARDIGAAAERENTERMRDFRDEAERQYQQKVAEMIELYDRATAAEAKVAAIREWYERDGSVGSLAALMTDANEPGGKA